MKLIVEDRPTPDHPEPIANLIEMVTKPRFRGRLHQAVFWLSLPAGALLIAAGKHPRAFVAAAIYIASTALCFGTSAAYHRGTWGPGALVRMQRADHAMIFVLITGSYTPLALLAMPPVWGVTLLAVAWTLAIGGVALTLMRWELMDRRGGYFYVAFGWLLVFALPLLVQTMSVAQIALLFGGGVLYTVGAVLFGLERPRLAPATFGYHELWHVMTVAAAVCHYVLIFQLVRT